MSSFIIGYILLSILHRLALRSMVLVQVYRYAPKSQKKRGVHNWPEYLGRWGTRNGELRNSYHGVLGRPKYIKSREL